MLFNYSSVNPINAVTKDSIQYALLENIDAMLLFQKIIAGSQSI